MARGVADGLIASLDTDAANVYLILTARELNPRIRVVARAEREESSTKLRRAGADEIISLVTLEVSCRARSAAGTSSIITYCVGTSEVKLGPSDSAARTSPASKLRRECTVQGAPQ